MDQDYDYIRKLSLDYNAWKQQLLSYEFITERDLDYNSCTAQWLAHCRPSTIDDGYVHAGIMLGTQNDASEPNRLLLFDLHLPRLPAIHANMGDHVDWTPVADIPMPGDVNRLRYMPQQPNIVAVHTSAPSLLISDWERAAASEPWFPNAASHCTSAGVDPGVRCQLSGHTDEGYGLSWHHHSAGKLASCAADGRVCVWDLGSSSQLAASSVYPVASYCHGSGTQAGINDVCWATGGAQHVVAAACEDGHVLLLDERQMSSGRPGSSAAAAAAPQQAPAASWHHSCAINCVAYDPHSPHQLAVGTVGRRVLLLDTRKLAGPVRSLRGHRGPVLQVCTLYGWQVQVVL